MNRIPSERYVSTTFMERELSMWSSVWLCVGRDEVDERQIYPVTEAWAGFHWAHLGGATESLASFLGDAAAAVDAYGVARWHTELALTTELPCNWKTSVDVHNESYHVRSVHPDVLSVVDVDQAVVDLLGVHSRIRVPMGRPSVSRRPEHAALSDAQLRDNHQIYIFPNLQLNLFADHGMALRHRPHPTDPQRCRFDLFVLRRAPGDGDPRLQEVDRSDALFGPVMGADLTMASRVQEGLRSPGFEGLFLGEDEAAIANMHRAIDAYLIDT